MNKIFLLIFIVLFSLPGMINASGDSTKIPLNISVYNNSTLLPGGADLLITSSVIHPGFEIGTFHNYKEKDKHIWRQTLNLGYFYHRYSQHAIQLYTELGYIYKFKKLNVGALLGVGYHHSIPDLELFEIEEGKGLVKKSNFGRAQYTVSPSIKIDYKINNNINVFCKYRLWLQMPFVENYVPILPNTAFHLGLMLNIKKVKNEK